MSRLRLAVVLLGITVVAGSTVAFAGSLGVASQHLTTAGTSVSVPKSVVTVTQVAAGGAPNAPRTTTATLSGGTPAAAGSLTFALRSGGTCAGTLVGTAETVTVNGASGQSYTSAARTPTTAGTYSWLASYSGDANNDQASSCTVITVAAITPQLHVSQISGSSANAGASGNWNATVTVTVRNSDGDPVGSVVVTGAWSPTALGSGNGCTTAASGSCSFTTPGGLPGFSNGESTTQTWTVSNLSRSGFTYNSSANAVSSITLSKP